MAKRIPKRMNISVPADLRRRMDKYKESVNWSAVAASAFEQKLGEIAQRKEKKKMVDVIQRLKASKLQHESDAAKAGYQDGQDWATNEAEAIQLQRLSDFRDSVGYDWGRCLGGVGVSTAYGPGELFYFIIEADDEKDRQDARDFWELLGKEHLNKELDYVYGFADGAIALWNEVADKL